METPDDCSWSVLVDVPWIALKAISDRGTGQVEYALQANTGEERVGSITIGNRASWVVQGPGVSARTNAGSGGGDGGGDGSSGDGSGGDAGGKALQLGAYRMPASLKYFTAPGWNGTVSPGSAPSFVRRGDRRMQLLEVVRSSRTRPW